VRSRRWRGRAAAPPEEFKSIVLGIGDGPFKGAPDARVTLVEFTDYQCPFCARHQKETVPQLLEKYVKTGKLKYVVRDFPLEAIHPAAVKAAEAPHCAGDGGKYWEMHELLFANPRAMAPADLVAHAQALGLDANAFQACMEGGKYTPRVNQARAEGARAGVRGTPSFFLGITEPNSDKITAVAAIRGARPFAKFQEEIETLLASPK
jgi:protein-disulfide isomerase